MGIHDTFILFDKTTGAITAFARGSVVGAGDYGMFPSGPADPALYYVALPLPGTGPYVVTARPEMSLTLTPASIPADGKTAAVLKGVPKGASVSFEGQTETADGSDIAITADHAAAYPIDVVLWPFRDTQITLTATDAST